VDQHTARNASVYLHSLDDPVAEFIEAIHETAELLPQHEIS
jgi:hypothetical protein